MQDNCKNIHINIPSHRRKISSQQSYHIEQQQHHNQKKSIQSIPAQYKKEVFHIGDEASNFQVVNINMISIDSKEELVRNKEIIVYDKNWQCKNSTRMADSRNQSHPQFYIDIPNRQPQHQQIPTNTKSKQKQKIRKLSEQLAKNQLLSIDTTQKKPSKKQIRTFIMHNKNMQTILTTHNTDKKMRKKSSFHNSKYNKSTTNKEQQTNTLQGQIKCQPGINKIDINNIYFDHNSRKNSHKNSRKSFKKNLHIHSQQNNNNSSQQFKYTHIQPNSYLYKNQHSYRYQHGNKSLSNFELLKMHAEQLQKSNIVLGSKEKGSNFQPNRKICIKQFVDNNAQNTNTNSNLNIDINNKPGTTNHICKSTHRSRYRQTLTNRKLTYDNCHNDQIRLHVDHRRKGSKLMNTTMDNLKKYNDNSNCDICRLNTQPSIGYADTSIFQNNYNNINNDQERKKTIRTHAQIHGNNKIYGQSSENNVENSLGEELQEHPYAYLPKTLSNRAKQSFKNQPQNTRTSQFKLKLNQNNKLAAYNNSRNGQRSRRIHTQMNIKGKDQIISNISYLLLRENTNKQENNDILQEQPLHSIQLINPNRVQSYSQAFIQNTTSTTNNLQASNTYIINNQFIPLANRSVLDKNRHNIKKISKNINRIFCNKNQNSRVSTIAGENKNQQGINQGINSNIEQFMKNKLSIIEISTNNNNMDNSKGKINYKNILYETNKNSKSIDKTILQDIHKEPTIEKQKPKQNKSKSISQPSIMVQKQSKIQKSETTNAARFYRNQLQKSKDKANIIHLDPFLRTKAIQLENNQQNQNQTKQNNEIVIICL